MQKSLSLLYADNKKRFSKIPFTIVPQISYNLKIVVHHIYLYLINSIVSYGFPLHEKKAQYIDILFDSNLFLTESNI